MHTFTEPSAHPGRAGLMIGSSAPRVPSASTQGARPERSVAPAASRKVLLYRGLRLKASALRCSCHARPNHSTLCCLQALS